MGNFLPGGLAAWHARSCNTAPRPPSLSMTVCQVQIKGSTDQQAVSILVFPWLLACFGSALYRLASLCVALTSFLLHGLWSFLSKCFCLSVCCCARIYSTLAFNVNHPTVCFRLCEHTSMSQTLKDRIDLMSQF